MSEGWPAQVVKETGVMGSDAAAEASHVAGKASEAVKGSAHAVQGVVTGVRRPLAPSPACPLSNCCLSLPCRLFFHLSRIFSSHWRSRYPT